MERRQMPRFMRRFTVRFSRDRQTWSTAFTSDVGPRGLFVTTRHPLQRHAEVFLEIDLPGGETIALTGRVAWLRSVPLNLQAVEHGGFGVELTQAPEAWFRFIVDLTS